MLSLSAHLIPVDIISSQSKSPVNTTGIRVTLFDVKNSDHISNILENANNTAGSIETVSVDCCRLELSQLQNIWKFVSKRFVQKLFLRNCYLSMAGLIVLVKELEKPDCNLIELDLRWNEFGDECALEIGKSFHKNKSVEKLYLAKNNITVAGTNGLINALITNHSSKLELLDLEDNIINNCEHFSDLIKKNNTLRTLQLNRNPIRGHNLEKSLAMIGEALLSNLSLLKITLPDTKSDDKSLSYWKGIIDQLINRNTLLNLHSKLKQTGMDAQNAGQFESGWDIQSIQTILKSISVNLHSQLSQLSLQHQKDITDLEKNPSQNLLNKENSEKRKIINENSKLNTELNRTYTKIHDLQKSVSTTKAEIESLMAVVTELEREKQDIKTTIQTLEDEVKQSSTYNDQLSRSLQLQPSESDLLQSHREQLENLTKSITLHLKDKGNLEKSLQKQKEQTESIGIILQQTLDISEQQLYPRESPSIMVKNSRENDCSICKEKEKVIAMVPCGHKCVCESCSERISICPVCRTKCSGKFRIYL